MWINNFVFDFASFELGGSNLIFWTKESVGKELAEYICQERQTFEEHKEEQPTIWGTGKVPKLVSSTVWSNKEWVAGEGYQFFAIIHSLLIILLFDW